MLNFRERNKTALRNGTLEGKPRVEATAQQERMVIGAAKDPNGHQRAAKALVREGRGPFRLFLESVIFQGQEMDGNSEKGPPPSLKEHPLDLGSRPLKGDRALNLLSRSWN